MTSRQVSQAMSAASNHDLWQYEEMWCGVDDCEGLCLWKSFSCKELKGRHTLLWGWLYLSFGCHNFSLSGPIAITAWKLNNQCITPPFSLTVIPTRINVIKTHSNVWFVTLHTGPFYLTGVSRRNKLASKSENSLVCCECDSIISECSSGFTVSWWSPFLQPTTLMTASLHLQFYPNWSPFGLNCSTNYYRKLFFDWHWFLFCSATHIASLSLHLTFAPFWPAKD